MNFNWIAKSDSPRLNWGYNGEGAEESHLKAREREDIANHAVLLRGVFHAKYHVKKATARICGLGFYCFWVNGSQCQEAVNMPLETNYRKRALYDELDITDFMTAGENVFGIELGNGRYSTPKKFWGWRARWHGDPLAALVVDILYENGERDQWKTDGSWKTAWSAIGRNCFYDGECYDAREEKEGWTQAGFDDGDWENAMVVNPPSKRIEKNDYFSIKKQRSLKPKKVSEVVYGMYVCDFGENIAGWVKIKVRGKRGTRVVIRYAEQLADTVDTRSMRYAANTDTYILKGADREEYEPRFTLHGFSGVEITLEDRGAELLEVTAYEVYADVEHSGDFWCDHDAVNRLHDVIMRTQHAALQGYPIDCPQRDERLGWLADAHVTDLTCMYNMNMASFYRKWLEDIHLDCHSETGAVPQIAPRVDFEHAVDWSTGYAIILWDSYLFYRDRQQLERYYPDIVRYVEFLAKDGPILKMSRYGDWMSTESGWKRGEPACCTTLYYCYNILLLIKIMNVLGKDSSRYEKLWNEVQEAVSRRFYHTETKLFDDGSQFSQSLALKLGIIPEEDRAQAIGKLTENIRNHGCHLTTGILGTKYVMEVLRDSGNEALAMQLILQREAPGWLDLIDGKTTLAESWDGAGSQNHCMFGSVDAIFYSMLGGIRVEEEITVQPYFAEAIHHVKCHTKVAAGEISVEWVRNGEFIELILCAPTDVKLILPDGREHLTRSCRISDIKL